MVVGAVALTLIASAYSGGTRVGGNTESSAANADGKGEVKGNIRLAYWGSGPRVELTDGVAKLFTSANPGVTVKSEFADFSAHFERLNVQASSGNMPCVTQLQGRQLNDYTTRGVLLDLQPMIDSGAIKVNDVPADVLDTGRGQDGKLYMIPYGAAYDSLMVNQAQAEAAGVGLPEDGYTWDDFGTYLKQANEKLPKGNPAISLGGGLPNWLISYVRGNGEDLFKGQEIGFSKQTLVNFWNFWEDLRKAGATTTPQQRSEEPQQVEQRYVAQGKVMSDNMPGNSLTPASDTLKGLQPNEKLTTLPLPKGTSAGGNVLFTSGFSIPKNCDNIPTAAAFINFWMNDDKGAALFASNNGAVVNSRHLQQQLDNPQLPAPKRHELELFQNIVEGKPPSVVYPPGYQANFEGAFTRAYESITLGGKSVEEAADAFFTEVNNALKAK
jgi:multiple sugar transport system substrate-binding protein